MVIANIPFRVCHIVTGDGWGGAERVVSLILEGMAQRGDVEINVVLFNNGQLTSTLNKLGIETYVIEEEQHSFFGLCQELRRWFSDKTFDIIHVHRYNELAAALWIFLSVTRSSPILSSPILITVHGLHPWFQMRLFDAAKCWLPMLVGRLLGVTFVAVSKEIQKRLCRIWGESRTMHIANPIPSCLDTGVSRKLRTPLGWPTAKRVVGFVGRLEWIKGPDLFLQIAKMCSDDIGFVIIGSGSFEGMLRETVRALRLEKRVRFLGQMEDAMPYLRQLDVLAITSRHEGLPMVLLEAAACEVPVVSFDVGGVGEVAKGQRAVHLIQAGDLEGFANAVENLLGDKKALRETIASWSAFVRTVYSLESIVEAYIKLYRIVRASGRRIRPRPGPAGVGSSR